MPLLSRNSGKLLSRVNGKPHATQNDHIDALPTLPTSNSTRSSTSQIAFETDEDIQRDPESSDDEQPAPLRSASEFRLPRQVDGGGEDEPPKPTDFLLPVRSSPGSAGSKRSNGSDQRSSDDDSGIFSSQGSFKRRKTYGGNIHALQKPASKQQGYGKAGRHSLPNRDSRPGFKDPRKHDNKPQTLAPAPKFKVAKGADMFEFGETNAGAGFKAPRKIADASMDADRADERFHSLSPSLSSLSSPPSSPEVEEIENLNLPAPRTFAPRSECTICGGEVDLLLKQNFEDEFTKGKYMSYKWQQRFCRHHKRHEASQLWDQKGYPNIDWDGLERRMRRQHSHLEDIMTNAKPSHYRRELSEKLKGRSKTALHAVNSDSEAEKRGVHVGYYGPRGEKAM